MSNEYIFFTDQTALTFRICLVLQFVWQLNSGFAGWEKIDLLWENSLFIYLLLGVL